MKKRMVSLSGLPLVEGKYHITATKPVIYEIESDADIVVEQGANVSFLDRTEGKNIKIWSLEDSSVEYTVIDGNGGNRCFEIEGEIHIHSIYLEKAKEILSIDLVKEGAKANVECLCIASDREDILQQQINHCKKNTFSDITNVAVAMEHANVLFDTTGKIDKGMSGSICRQLSRGIVMDDCSAITAKPILLIDEFDCFANHGASIGKMSDEDLFYLMSRGLSKNDAFLLILKGIIEPFISKLEMEDLRIEIERKVSNLIEK